MYKIKYIQVSHFMTVGATWMSGRIIPIRQPWVCFKHAYIQLLSCSVVCGHSAATYWNTGCIDVMYFRTHLPVFILDDYSQAILVFKGGMPHSPLSLFWGSGVQPLFTPDMGRASICVCDVCVCVTEAVYMFCLSWVRVSNSSLECHVTWILQHRYVVPNPNHIILHSRQAELNNRGFRDTTTADTTAGCGTCTHDLSISGQVLYQLRLCCPPYSSLFLSTIYWYMYGSIISVYLHLYVNECWFHSPKTCHTRVTRHTELVLKGLPLYRLSLTQNMPHQSD